MKLLRSHKTLTLLLPHILIAGGLLTIPIIIGFSNSYSMASMLFKFLFPFIILTIFYINYLYLIDRFLFKRKFILFSLLNALLIIGSFYLHKSSFVHELRQEHHRLERIELNNENEHEVLEKNNFKDSEWKDFRKRKGNVDLNWNKNKRRRDKISGRYSFGFLLFQFIAILTAVGIKFGKRAKTEESRRKDIESAYLKSKHDLLRYQLQPHFFFNTLNSIHYLIDISTTKAQETLIDLSQLMRYVLNVTEKELVELDAELEFTKNYCELMRLRTADNLDFKLNIERGENPKEIAPLLMIVLIENAFKHGVSGRDTDFININITESENAINISVKNSRYVNNVVQNDDVSIGLDNLKSRLKLIYPEKHEISVKQSLTSYETILTLNL